ncbi:NUDIX domain-containing protein [Altererythrobacter soli]|uniref:NUDIX domain-containing protein n=1 Tax=Croceibacterium soli TaxID=1739690 RepID=A0A6I4UU19_9SPHN|nr:NUDIX domain-containing protein [Croceibacterium soli]MXP41996.1 NUDIX domain-containing protein [Croceibacterium soli]
MLHLIPAPLHRLALRLAHRLRKRWPWLTGYSGAGVSVIGLDEAGRVLLVRHGYGSGKWSLPGGGVGKGEDPEACARREMREELGCELEDLALAASFEHPLHGAAHRAYVFTARFRGDPRPDGREVIEARWFARDALPEGLAAPARRRLLLAFPEISASSRSS